MKNKVILLTLRGGKNEHLRAAANYAQSIADLDEYFGEFGAVRMRPPKKGKKPVCRGNSRLRMYYGSSKAFGLPHTIKRNGRAVRRPMFRSGKVAYVANSRGGLCHAYTKKGTQVRRSARLRK